VSSLNEAPVLACRSKNGCRTHLGSHQSGVFLKIILLAVLGAISANPAFAFECWIQAYWTESAAAAKSIEWVNKFWERTAALSNGMVYVNYLEDEGDERVGATYGPNYDRLVMLKNKYDPANFFRLNQNIRPTV
jgi:hypothetical protein